MQSRVDPESRFVSISSTFFFPAHTRLFYFVPFISQLRLVEYDIERRDPMTFAVTSRCTRRDISPTVGRNWVNTIYSFNYPGTARKKLKNMIYSY